jgi:hypothetical protein
MYPFKRNQLDDPEVLRSAPDNVWLEQNVVLQCRGITYKAIPLSETNLLELGLGQLAGGVNATESLAQTLHDLNHMNATTANILKLVELAKKYSCGEDETQHACEHCHARRVPEEVQVFTKTYFQCHLWRW